MATATEQLNIRVAPTLAAKLRRLAQRQKTSVSHEVNIALRAHIDASERRA